MHEWSRWFHPLPTSLYLSSAHCFWGCLVRVHAMWAAKLRTGYSSSSSPDLATVKTASRHGLRLYTGRKETRGCRSTETIQASTQSEVHSDKLNTYLRLSTYQIFGYIWVTRTQSCSPRSERSPLGCVWTYKQTLTEAFIFDLMTRLTHTHKKKTSSRSEAFHCCVGLYIWVCSSVFFFFSWDEHSLNDRRNCCCSFLLLFSFFLSFSNPVWFFSFLSVSLFVCLFCSFLPICLFLCSFCFFVTRYGWQELKSRY